MREVFTPQGVMKRGGVLPRVYYPKRYPGRRVSLFGVFFIFLGGVIFYQKTAIPCFRNFAF